MATKKVSYKNLLKEALSEFDTSKTVEVKGPMLDPILSWDGDGELPIYKDAASILERYYFNEDVDVKVTVDDLTETEYNEDGTEAKTSAEKHGEGTGTEQAGTADASSIRGMEKEQEKDIAKEMEDLFTEETEEEKEEEEKEDEKDGEEKEMEEALMHFFSEQDEDTDKDAGADEPELDVDKKVEEGVEDNDADDADDADEAGVTEDIENAVIEKLIDEMEEVDEMDMTYTGDGVKKGMEASKEKKASGPEEDTKGAGTEQAGTGTAAGQVPNRKDVADQMVKPKNYSEGDDPSAVPGGPAPDKDEEDLDENEDLAEAFEIFKEAIEDDDATEDDIKV